jgi:hypothetical protein
VEPQMEEEEEEKKKKKKKKKYYSNYNGTYIQYIQGLCEFRLCKVDLLNERERCNI